VVRRPPSGRLAARGTVVIIIAALLLSALLSSSSPAAVQTRRAAVRSSKPPVVVIVMENHEYGSIMGSPRARYLRSFARGGTLFTRFHAQHHPSLPNYLQMTSGQTSGCGSDDCPKRRYRTNNLFRQLSTAGVRWETWAESMGSRCSMDTRGRYASWHNPPLYYRNLFPRICRRRDVPYPRYLPRVLPRFVFAIPDSCHDMHDCSIATGSHWLRSHVPPLLHHGAVVIITFDEGVTGAGGGGHIFTAMRGPGVPAGKRDGHRYNHRSLLAGVERRFGLQRLYGARHARPLPVP
jgi:hypothetical protein